jgi:hypothetical protein
MYLFFFSARKAVTSTAKNYMARPLRWQWPGGLRRGGHIGGMSAKANGAFTITTGTQTCTVIGKKHCLALLRADGAAIN